MQTAILAASRDEGNATQVKMKLHVGATNQKGVFLFLLLHFVTSLLPSILKAYSPFLLEK